MSVIYSPAPMSVRLVVVVLIAVLAAACAFDPPPPLPAPALATMTSSAGVLDPAFDPLVLNYDLDLRLAESSFALTLTGVNGLDLQIAVSNTEVEPGEPTPEIPVEPGTQTVEITASSGGDVVTYTLLVNRGVDALADMAISVGQLNPSFDPLVVNYFTPLLLVENGISVVPTLLTPLRSSIIVDGGQVLSGETSALIDLVPGPNSLEIEVVPATRDPVTYNVEALRGTDALSALEVTRDGARLPNFLESSFSPSEFIYPVAVGELIESIQIRAASHAADATIVVNGVPLVSGESSQLIPIGVGLTPVSVVLTAPTGERQTYTLEMSRANAAVERHYVKASNTQVGDRFGAVALHSDTLVIGAPYEDSAAMGVDGNQDSNTAIGSGAAYIFRRVGDSWIQEAYLKASVPSALDGFGSKVAIWGDLVAVSAPGEDSAATGINGSQSDEGAENAGAVYVFRRTETSWGQDAYLKASNTGAGDAFGSSLALWEDVLVVGAAQEDVAVGAVYVFSRGPTGWAPPEYLKASNMDEFDYFGADVAIWGETLVVGAPGEASASRSTNPDPTDDTAPGAGAAYVFRNNGEAWAEQAYLKASNTDAGDLFGFAVTIAGNAIAIGAPEEDSFVNPDSNLHDAVGAVYLFAWNGSAWSPDSNYLKSYSANAEDRFGSSLAMWGGSLVIGAPGDDHGAVAGKTGAVYVSNRSNASWSRPPIPHYASNSEESAGIGDELESFGSDVALWGDTFAVGAWGEDGDATGVDGESTNASPDSGAVYILQ